jgi:gelsolin-related protein of 125 kDa
MKFSKIPCSANAYSLEDDSNLMKVKITVMHDGINYNGSKFTLQDMKRAEESVKNIPILGYVLRDTDGNLDDFDGHNMETRIKDSDKGFEIETYYLEKPIGVVPESCNPRYEEIDGLNHLIVDGYIWKSYSNGSYKLIENSSFKGVSMEIEVLDGNWNELENVYDITDYRYTGITVLGDMVEPAMGDTCRIQKYSACADYKDALADIYREIYSLERKEDNMEEVKEEIIVETQQEPEIEEVVESEETKEEVVEAEEVAQTEEIVEEVETPEETEVVEEVKEESDTLDVFAELLEEVPGTLKEVADMITEKFSMINEELKTLREFKSKIDLKELKGQVDEISNKYDLDVDTTELKEKAITKDITLEQFEKELKVLFAEKVLENGKFSKDVKEEPAKVTVTSHEEDKTIYGGLFEKHGLK